MKSRGEFSPGPREFWVKERRERRSKCDSQGSRGVGVIPERGTERQRQREGLEQRGAEGGKEASPSHKTRWIKVVCEFLPRPVLATGG